MNIGGALPMAPGRLAPRWGRQALLLDFIAREERAGNMNKKSVNDVTREWWSVALRGVVAVLAGVVVVVSPIPHLDPIPFK
jgi:hypothetical protein